MFQVYWCSGVEQCLAAPSPSAALAQYLLTCTAQLGALTRLVRGSLPDLHRRTLAALITIDVHARDIVDNLIRSDVCIAMLVYQSIVCGLHCIRLEVLTTGAEPCAALLVYSHKTIEPEKTEDCCTFKRLGNIARITA